MKHRVQQLFRTNFFRCSTTPKKPRTRMVLVLKHRTIMVRNARKEKGKVWIAAANEIKRQHFGQKEWRNERLSRTREQPKRNFLPLCAQHLHLTPYTYMGGSTQSKNSSLTLVYAAAAATTPSDTKPTAEANDLLALGLSDAFLHFRPLHQKRRILFSGRELGRELVSDSSVVELEPPPPPLEDDRASCPCSSRSSSSERLRFLDVDSESTTSEDCAV